MRPRTQALAAACGAAAFVMATAVVAAGAPAVGDAYIYNFINGYSKEIQGQLLHEVTQAGSAGVTFSVTPDNAMAG